MGKPACYVVIMKKRGCVEGKKISSEIEWQVISGTCVRQYSTFKNPRLHFITCQSVEFKTIFALFISVHTTFSFYISFHDVHY